MEYGEGFGKVKLLVLQGNQVGDGHALRIVEPVHLMGAGQGDFFRVVRQLHLGHQAAVFFQRAHLVDTAQGIAPGAGDQLGAHTPEVNAGALKLQVPDDVLIQVVGCHNDGIGEARRVKHLAGFFAEICQVARIQADAQRLAAPGAHLFKDLDGIGNAGVQGIKGVHQQQAAVGKILRVGTEGFKLALKAHHPAVGVGAADRDAEALPGHHIAGGVAAANDGRARPQHPGVRPLGAPQAKLHHLVPLGRAGHPVALGGNQGLVADEVEHGGLNQLGLGQRRCDPHHGLAREDEGTLGHDVNVPLKAEIVKALEEILLKDAQAPEIIHIFLREAQVLHIFLELGVARHHRVGQVIPAAVEHIEHRPPLPHAVPAVAGEHGQFVQIRQHGEVTHGLFSFFQVDEGVNGAGPQAGGGV